MLQIKKKYEKTSGSIFVPGKYPGENICASGQFFWHEDNTQPEIHVPLYPRADKPRVFMFGLCNVLGLKVMSV